MVLSHYPWAGDSDPIVPGCRLLVIGESHYAPLDADEQAIADIENPVFTNHLVRDVISGKRQERFFTNLGMLLSIARAGFVLDGEVSPTSVWRNVAFANIIQRVLRGPDEHPAAEDWIGVGDALREIVGVVEPDAILVASTRVWDKLNDPVCFPAGWSSEPTEYPDVVRWYGSTCPRLFASWCAHGSRAVRTGEHWNQAVEHAQALFDAATEVV